MNFKLIWKLFPLSVLLMIIGSGVSGQDFRKDRSLEGKALEGPTISRELPENYKHVLRNYQDEKFPVITGAEYEKLFDMAKQDALRTTQVRPPYTKVIPPSVNSPDELDPKSELPIFNKSAEKSTGSFSATPRVNVVIANNTAENFAVSPSESLPYGAVVTDFVYRLRIDDNSNEALFYPEDYQIMATAESIPGGVLTILYDNLGTGHTDGGYDDDVEDDSDIYLNSRHSSWFNGEPADQMFTLRVWDNNPLASEGIIDYVTLTIYWEAPDLPNLTTLYTPGGWDAPMVVNHTIGSHANASVLYAGITTYVNLCYMNEDFYAPGPFYFDFYIDGGLTTWWDRADANADWYYTFENREYVFTAGSHTLCQFVDGLDEVEESNETDNEYCHTFTWVGPPDPPSLSYPSGGATCMGTALTFSWNPSDYATVYRLQVDDNSDFSSPAINMAVSGTSQYVAGLTADHTYYWRVRATNPAGNSAYSSYRQFTTAPATGPAAPSLESPADEAYCQPTTLTLDWHSVAGAATYWLQVDNDADFSSPVVFETGIAATEYEVSGLSGNYTYHWRVAAVNACGSTSSWSSARVFYTAGTPSTPALDEPSNGATCQPNGITFSWGEVSGAENYHFRVDDNDDFSSPIVNNTDVATNSILLVADYEPGTTYYWDVRAKNACDIYSGWSSTFSFTTSPSAPDAPALSSPTDDATCQPLSLTLEWGAVSGAATYTLQLDDVADFSSPQLEAPDIGTNSYEVAGLTEGTKYYWRVKSINSCGVAGDWSAGNSFTTLITTIGTPVLSGPADGEDCQPVEITLSWQTVSAATGYSIEVDDNADFSSPECSGDPGGTSYNCEGLSENTLYYWHVAANGNCSVTGDWSGAWSFETGSLGPEAPSLNEPADNSVDQALSLTVSWSEAAGATGYQFQLGENEDMGSPMIDEEVTTTSYDVSGLDEETTYFWRVRSKGECSAGSWSDIWEFSTAAGSGPDAITSNYENKFYLGQNHPNPFMETTTIEFNLPIDSKVNFEFFDLQGNIVETITRFFIAGSHSIEFNAGGKVQSGVYIYRMRTLGFTDTKLCVVR